MRLAQIVGGVVVNVIKVDGAVARPDWCADWPEIGDTGGPGWTYDGTSFAPPAPETAPAAALTAAQWSFFLDVTGFRAALDAALAALPKSTLQERTTWAGIKAVAYGSDSFRLPVTLALVAQVRGLGLSGVSVPTDQDITDAWPIAAAFAGAASLGVTA